MTAALLTPASILSAVRRLPGPVFEKELRVASRRRRSYLLRFIYVSLLTVFMVVVWLSFVDSASPGAVVYQSSRRAAAGRCLAIAIVWFQFIAAQVGAPVLLGDAIRSEVRKRTLHMLAVTPLSSMQIVVGKLAGGLLPIVMLLGTSLPLLALVRVFGGVPWDFLLSGIGITFSALVFAGTLHLLVSAPPRRALTAIAPTLWFCLLGEVPDGLLAWLSLTHPALGAIGRPILWFVNPTDVLLARTRDLLAARPATGLSSGWPLHCLILLAASVLVLWRAARRVRIVAAEPNPDRTHESGMYRLGMWAGKKVSQTNSPIGQRPRRIIPSKRVEGSPVLWKELRTFAVRRRGSRLALYSAPAFLTCVIAAALMGVFGTGSNASAFIGSMVFCVLGLQVAAAVGLAGTAATVISKEREARTLPVLLATPLEDGRIVRDEALAVVRQSLPTLVLYFVLLLLASAGVVASMPTKVRPLPLVYGAGACLGLYLVGWLGILPFLTGLGLYCGARLKTAAAARGCTFAVLLLGVVLSFVIIALLFSLVWSSRQAWLTGAAVVIGTALACAGVGLILLWAAARRLRRNIF